jgi:hypothetical protein
MSCGGNRFACGITRFDKHKMTADKPTNQALHSDTEKRLQEMLNARAQQDGGVFQPINEYKEMPTSKIITTPQNIEKIDKSDKSYYTPFSYKY